MRRLLHTFCWWCIAVLPLQGQELSPRLTRYEVGGQLALFNVSLLQGLSRVEPGFGGNLTVNLNRFIAFDSAVNYYPVDYNAFLEISTAYGGRTFSAVAGAKGGYRHRSWALFAKARPGLIRFSRVGDLGPTLGTSPRTYLMLDMGPVFEFSPTTRVVLRTEIGFDSIRFPLRSLTTPDVIYRTGITGFHTQASLTTGIEIRLGRKVRP